MIAIIDYGMGNLASVRNAFLKLGYKAFTTSNPDEIMKADKVVLPGVGAFSDAINNITKLGIDVTIRDIVNMQKPLLGICLGLQLLFTESEENGINKGLDIIKGRVTKLPPVYKVPHMGWNEIITSNDSRLFKGINPKSHFYFVHSYYVVPNDFTVISAQTDYGVNFVSAIEKDNLFATQFHPEKSGEIGLKILKNFGEMK